MNGSTPATAPFQSSLRLDQLLLLGAVTLVIVILGLTGALQVLSTNREFDEATAAQRARLETRAREVGQTIAQLLAIASGNALRDNDYGSISGIIGPVGERNKDVLRIRVFDNEGRLVADTREDAGEEAAGAAPSSRWHETSFEGRSAIEFEEPIAFSQRAAPGAVRLVYSLESLAASVQLLEAGRAQSVRRTVLRTVALGISFAALGGLLAALLSRQVTRRLKALTHEVSRLGAGDLSARVDTSARGAGREVQVLGQVFNQMADQLSRLVDVAKNKAALDREMHLAQSVQQALLPSRDALETGPLRVAGLIKTADQCGGDWWLRLPLSNRYFVLGVGDVVGHGLSTALIATSAVSGIVAAIKMTDRERVEPGALIAALNDTLVQLGRGKYQMTCCLSVFDLVTGEITFANAGHPHALVFNRAHRQVDPLLSRGPLVGAEQGVSYESHRRTLSQGDVVVWYSDGLIEGTSPSNHEYGRNRLRKALVAHGDQSAAELRDRLIADAQGFYAQAPQGDDITVVVAELRPLEEKAVA